MDQSKPLKAGQVEYQGRWVDRAHFCAFVYNDKGQKLAKSYDEFSALLATGLWFDAKQKALDAIIKVEDVKPLEVEEPIIEEKVVEQESEEVSLALEEVIVEEVQPKEAEVVPSVLEKLIKDQKPGREATKNALKAANLGK